MSVKATKKQSAQSEIVFGQAAANIKKAVSEMNAAVEAVNGLEAKGEELTLLIANKEEELTNIKAEKEAAIKSLDTEFAEKQRAAEVQLDLNMKARKEGVVLEYLRNTGQTAVPANTVSDLQAELEEVREKFDTNVRAEVAKATNALSSQHKSEIALKDAEYRAKEAENLSQIKVLAEKVIFLEKQNTMLVGQLDSARQATVDVAKAGSVGTINLGSNGNGR